MAAKRGSETIAAGGFDPAKLKAVVAQLKKLKLNPDIIINGQPWPDLFKGSFKAGNPDKFVAGLRSIFDLGAAHYDFNNILTRGTPIPDEIMVKFEVRTR